MLTQQKIEFWKAKKYAEIAQMKRSEQRRDFKFMLHRISIRKVRILILWKK